MKTTELGYHKEYGLTDEIRIRVVRDAQEMPIKMAAQKNRVALSSVYKWRNRGRPPPPSTGQNHD
jgi:hypothetical protein